MMTISIYLSVLVTGEIRKGIELARKRDSAKAAALEAWLKQVVDAFGDRILPINLTISDEWGRMSALRTVSVTDGLLAASAKVHGLILATRNDAQMSGLGADVLNPFRSV
jgi:hypothetical protein